ncbi:MAG: PKD domain-containing protein [Holophagales bacterium]|nr:PKD domain-containing protein [Holophagales bacterium]
MISQVAGGDAGLVIDDVRIQEIASVPPVADFTGSPLTGQAPLQVTFTDTSTGAVTIRRWDFDNDGVFEVLDGGPQELHEYTTPGTYSVRLQVEGPGGEDTLIRNGYVVVTQPAQVPVIVNGSFEDDPLPIFGSGRVDQGNPLSGWTVTDPARAGRNVQGMPYYNNGQNPHGLQVGFIKMLTSMKQTLHNFEAGRNYVLSLAVNARADFPTPTLRIKLGGAIVDTRAVQARQGADQHTLPFATISVPVSPGAGSHELEISQIAGGDAGLVIDDVAIQPVN